MITIIKTTNNTKHIYNDNNNNASMHHNTTNINHTKHNVNT